MRAVYRGSTPALASGRFRARTAAPLSIYRVSRSSAVSGDRNKIVAALLAFLLGGLGIHEFYLGKTTAGMIRYVQGDKSWF